jgi:hypothetical protein
MQHSHRFHRVLLAGLAVVGVAVAGAWLGELHKARTFHGSGFWALWR